MELPITILIYSHHFKIPTASRQAQITRGKRSRYSSKCRPRFFTCNSISYHRSKLCLPTIQQDEACSPASSRKIPLLIWQLPKVKEKGNYEFAIRIINRDIPPVSSHNIQTSPLYLRYIGFPMPPPKAGDCVPPPLYGAGLANRAMLEPEPLPPPLRLLCPVPGLGIGGAFALPK